MWANPTGKEEDVEVGLVYFGKRSLNTSLQRWVSADPLEVHGPGEADANLYAYVRGRALQAIDPLGLEDDNGGDWSLWEAVKANVVGALDVAGVPSTLAEAGAAASEGNYTEAVAKVGEAMARGNFAPIVMVVEAGKGLFETGEALGRMSINQGQPGDAQMVANTGVGLAGGVLLAKVGGGAKGGPSVEKVGGTGRPSGPKATSTQVAGESPKAKTASPTETVEWLGGEAISPDNVVVQSGEARYQYHYTDAPAESFQNGVWEGTSVTPEGNLNPQAASQTLGIPVPDKVIAIRDTGQIKAGSQPVQQSNRYSGGGADNVTTAHTPASQIEIKPLKGGE